MKVGQRRPSHTAFHEAGHVVATWSLGFRVVYATIIPQSHAAGEAKHEPTGRSDLVAVIAFAGPAAQRRSHPRSNIAHGASFDREVITIAAEVLFAALHDRKSFIRQADREARAIVDRHWLAVDAVAQALMERQALSGFAIEGIIREAEEEWAAASLSRPGCSAFDYARERREAARGLPQLRRSHVEAASLRAVLAGAADIEATIGTDLVARGYPAADVAALLQRIRSTAA